MTEPSMVEKVARAISKSEIQDEGGWEAFMSEARAAIKAMREPTDAMVAAASGTGLCPSGVADIYIDMVNAALQECKEGE